MTRVVSLFLPTWSTDRVQAEDWATQRLRLRRRSSWSAGTGRRRVVLAADAAAQARRPARRHARDQGPGAGAGPDRSRTPIPPPTPRRWTGWRSGCCSATRRSSPPIRPMGWSSTPPAPTHLHGGEDAMLADMVARARRRRHSRARAAIADTWGAAHALARFSARPTLRLRGRETAAADVADLPIAALRLPGAWSTVSACSASTRIGELLAQPRAPLALRFGPELGRRLDQAMGRIAEPIDPIRPPELIEVRRVFAEPIGAPETIARYIGKLVGQLCDALGGQGPRRAAARSALPSRRQSHRGHPRRHGAAGARCKAPDPAALRQDRNHRSRLRHRDHDARRDRWPSRWHRSRRSPAWPRSRSPMSPA